jgi:hypothetical protein
MTTQNQSITNVEKVTMSKEIAQKIMAAGQAKRGGVVIHVFDNTLSNLPKITNDELNNEDFIIINFCGDINTEYGPAWIFEIGRNPDLPTHSWLVGQQSIIGDNLLKYSNRRGGWAKSLPLWLHLSLHAGVKGGRDYWALGTPMVILEALDQAPKQEAADSQAEREHYNELEDLPF